MEALRGGQTNDGRLGDVLLFGRSGRAKGKHHAVAGVANWMPERKNTHTTRGAQQSAHQQQRLQEADVPYSICGKRGKK